MQIFSFFFMNFSQNIWSNAGFCPLNLRHTSTFGRRLHCVHFPRSYGRKLQHIRYFFCPKMHFFLKKFAYVQFLLYLCTRFLKRMHILVPCPSG